MKQEWQKSPPWDQANRRQKLGLVWRNRKIISPIIKGYFYLPFFLLIILWHRSSPQATHVFSPQCFGMWIRIRLICISGSGFGMRIQEQGNWPKLTNILIFCLYERQKAFFTFVGTVCFMTYYILPIKSIFSCKSSSFCDGKVWLGFGSVWIRVGLALWIRIQIRIEVKSWIRIWIYNTCSRKGRYD